MLMSLQQPLFQQHSYGPKVPAKLATNMPLRSEAETDRLVRKLATLGCPKAGDSLHACMSLLFPTAYPADFHLHRADGPVDGDSVSRPPRRALAKQLYCPHVHAVVLYTLHESYSLTCGPELPVDRNFCWQRYGNEMCEERGLPRNLRGYQGCCNIWPSWAWVCL